MKTLPVQIGSIAVGGENPIRIQSMTNTPTADVEATVAQIIELFQAGSELVRITVNDPAAAEAVPKIRAELVGRGFDIPLVGDFHFNGHVLLERYPEMASALDKWRVNPGNVGMGKKRDENFETIIKLAIKHEKPIRIGVNVGSLDQELLQELMDANAERAEPKSDQEVLVEAMVESAIRSAELAEQVGLAANQIILSVKMSELPEMIKAYQLLNQRLIEMNKPYPLHLGLTEAGGGTQGLVSSAAALGILLNQGVGNTIRISLTPEPGSKRTQEVEACQQLLQSLGLRSFKPKVTSCPGCGRTSNDRYQKLAQEVRQYIDQRMPEWQQKYPGVERLKIAVMGCVVNGPGEAKYADIAISLPGNSEEPVAQVYLKGKLYKTLQGDKVADDFKALLDKCLLELMT